MPVYDPKGIIDQYIYTLISELYTISDYIIIVSNSLLTDDDYAQLSAKVDKLIIRDNVGYDAAAYQDIITNHLTTQQLASFEQIVFCNDTFFGPFIPFEDIFAAMSNKKVDFWAMSYIDGGLFSYLSSYFMVFGSQIIKDKALFDFFTNQMHQPINTWLDACMYFEVGIFRYLTARGYSFAAYAQNPQYRLYTNADLAIAEDKIPIIKKRAFSATFYNQDIIINALQMVKKHDNYNISHILDAVKRVYGIELDLATIDNYQPNLSLIKREIMGKSSLSQDDIAKFMAGIDRFYIYGKGYYALFFIITAAKYQHKLAGFIVSDDQKDTDNYINLPVYQLSNIKQSLKNDNIGVIIGLNWNNSRAVKLDLDNNINTLYLWDNI